MKVPFVDLNSQYQSIKTEIDQAIQEIMDTSSFIGGKAVENFEERFAAYIGVNNCIGVANGTDAIEIALEAIGIGKGDEVIVPAFSWISTASAVSRVGATPVFVDVHPDYYTLDVEKIELKITSLTKAIIPVHFYGLPADMPSILKIADKNDLMVVEDCAQSHGASINGQKVGTFGDVSIFSFYPGKNLGGYGDGGSIVTSNDEIADQCRLIARLGQKGKHNHLIIGRNSRLDTLQASILNVKLDYLDNWIGVRNNVAAMYANLLQGTDVKLPLIPDGYQHVYHLFVIQADKRDELQNYLTDKDIRTQIHYPTPITSTKPYSSIDKYPVSEEMSERILSLPMYAELDVKRIAYVAETIKNFLNDRG